MKNKLLLPLLLLLLSLFVNSCKKPEAKSETTQIQYGTGAILNRSAYLKTPVANFDKIKASLVSKGLLSTAKIAGGPPPTSMILEYPSVGDQGSTGACVGWAVGYSLLGTLNNEFSDSGTFGARSPWFIYHTYNSLNVNCSDPGMYLYYGMNILQLDGVPANSYDPSFGSSCNAPSSSANSDAISDRVDSVYAISTINDIKTAISMKLPVAMGFGSNQLFIDAFNNHTTFNNVSGNITFAHAVCIIGYDDAKNAVLVENSWGIYGGDATYHGCMWIDYSVITNPNFMAEMYVATPQIHTVAAYNTEGDFVKNDNTGQIFMVMDGTLRYIPNVNVLYGLFNYSGGLLNHFTTAQLANAKMGTTINPDNNLIDDTTTGKVYFREVNTLRWIPATSIMSKYHFNWNAIQNKNGLSGYIVSWDFL